MELFNIDCFEGHKKLKDKSINLIITDLPFGTTDCQWDKQLPLDKLWVDYKRIIKSNGTIILFGTGIFFAQIILSNQEWFKYDIIWEKERLVNIFQTKKQIGRIHENLAIFYDKQGTYNPIMKDRFNRTIGIFKGEKKSQTHNNQTYKYANDYDNTKTYPTSILKFNRDCLKENYHPTQKPVKLLEYLIYTFSNEGDLILDSCMGSGTTGVASINTNRNFIGFEIDKKFFELAEKRIKYFEEKKDKFFTKKLDLKEK
jgi:site-specific DNA-methyltransferase (adenine-specific)